MKKNIRGAGLQKKTFKNQSILVDIHEIYFSKKYNNNNAKLYSSYLGNKEPTWANLFPSLVKSSHIITSKIDIISFFHNLLKS